jgi:predicted nucleotidyltransferase component of viral defense system
MNKQDTNRKLHYKTVTPQLQKILIDLMRTSLFNPFCLAGGTSLSLRLGHRASVDIDLFTNAPYGSLDFMTFEDFFKKNYPYCSRPDKTDIVGFGRSYYIGNSEDNNIKIDLYYHDEIIAPVDLIDGIRFVNLNDVIAMKVDVISRGGRKKDFWDLHELLGMFSISEMLEIHRQHFEYTHDRERIINNFINFEIADEEIDPVCLKGKIWELIKLDFTEEIEKLKILLSKNDITLI